MPTPRRLRSIKAVRIAIVVRSEHQERADLAAENKLSASLVGQTAWLFNCAANNATCQGRIQIDNTVLNDYSRYRIYETVIPLRNALWSNPMTPARIVFRRRAPARRQRGVVLFVALIGMVVLSLAAVALLRSVDSGTSIAGNLAFKQATIGPINYAIEQANYALFDAPAASRIADPWNHAPRSTITRTCSRGNRRPAFPRALWSLVHVSGRVQHLLPVRSRRVPGPLDHRADVPGLGAGAGSLHGRPADQRWPAGLRHHGAEGLVGRTTMKLIGIPVNPIPLYRVTVRVDGPSNTVTYAQAMLR